jgi:hypothetical protein
VRLSCLLWLDIYPLASWSGDRLWLLPDTELPVLRIAADWSVAVFHETKLTTSKQETAGSTP